MHLLKLSHPFDLHTLHQKKRASHSSRRKSRPRLCIPLAIRLALGFFLAALFAATTTWQMGIQHAETLRKQSNFYQVLLQTNMQLTDGSELLKSIDSQSTQILEDAENNSPDGNNLALHNLVLEERGLSALMTSYDSILLTYASHDLLSQYPNQSMLLDSANTHTQIEQERTYTSGALHTWQVYHDVQNTILQDIKLGNIAQAQNVARLQGEPAYVDARSALHSLIQFNEQLSVLVDREAKYETEHQFIYSLIGSILTFLGVLLICIIISHSLVHRLKQLHRITQAVERGQTDARVSVTGHDEIADVSNSVNTMLDTLVDAIQQTTAAKQQVDHAYQQERQLNQMKDLFIRNVSHEIRTPLTEIYGFLQLLHEHKENVDATTQAFFVEQAIQGCEDLLSLFTTILDAAHIDAMALSPKLEKLPLYPIIKSILEQCDPREIEDHPIDLEVPGSLAVWADLQYLCQILRNLLSNAFKYTPPKTPLSICASWHDTTKEASLKPSHVRICVKDTGPGIPPEEQGMLFQQFVRLQRDLSGTIRGTGLGLYLCQQFVQAMQGQIWVESSGITGEGSSFCFTLPIEPPTPFVGVVPCADPVHP